MVSNQNVTSTRPEIPLSENSLAVLEKRYLRRGPDGQPEESVQDMFLRVAAHIAKPEREHGGDAAQYPKYGHDEQQPRRLEDAQ